MAKDFDWKDLDAVDVPSSLSLRQELLGLCQPGTRIVDLGCGTGDQGMELARLTGAEVTGVDVNPHAVAVAMARAGSRGLPLVFLCQDATNQTSLPGGCFDVASMQAFLSVLRDRSQRERALAEARRLLKGDGQLFFHDFAQAWHHPTYRARYQEGLREFGEEGTFRAHLDVDPEVAYISHHFSEKEVVELLIRAGFRIQSFAYERVRTQSGNQIYGFTIVAGTRAS